MNAVVTEETIVTIGMAQTAVVKSGQKIRTVLGSCIGLVLYDAARRTGGMAHIVLAASLGREGPPGKFADTAVPDLINRLEQAGACRRRLVAKITGGADMFGTGGPIQIGRSNIAKVRKLLEDHRIRIAAEHIGGTKGRRVTFDPDTGALLVEIAGEAPVTL